MRRSFLVRVVIVGTLPFMLGMFAGCLDPMENCNEARKCGNKTLKACATYDGCRFKSDDGHSWSCTRTESSGSDPGLCESTSCTIAAQEASDWCFVQSAVPTPVPTPTLAEQVIITELMHNPEVVADDLGEWFEIYNTSIKALDLFGCEIRDRSSSHTIAAHFLVPSGAFRTAAIFATGGGFVPDYTYSGITFDNDAADEVSMWCGSTLIDRFEYASSQASTSGHALSWDPFGYSSFRKDVPQYVCPAKSAYNTSGTGSGSISDYGTPGTVNPRCP